jgi:predicted ribosome quality control (RQC) complex YloA/Tae2 family protein
MAEEICYRADLDSSLPASSISDGQMERLWNVFDLFMSRIRNSEFSPAVIYENGIPREYAAFHLLSYEKMKDCSIKEYKDMSILLTDFYAEKNALTRIRQKSASLRHITSTALERTVRKYDLQQHQMKDTEKRDRYRIYGELLNVYGYSAEPSAKSITVNDYNTGKDVTIPLDPTMTPQQNAKKYFDRYSKLKRTAETLSQLTVEVKAEIDHLESIQNALDIAQTESDLVPIREELIEAGYIHKKREISKGKKNLEKSQPFHYISSDGFDIYVGKNNYQNDQLTFKVANGGDWWFHAKGMPGSHVVLRTGGKKVPDRAFEEAAALAAYYSKAREQDKVEIDYLQRKDVKKPGGAKPGFVVYYTNYSMAIKPDISSVSPADSQ